MLTSVPSCSSTGKTQFLLQLLLSVQLPAPRGLSKNALYISTETDLPSTRLRELLSKHPELPQHAKPGRPSLDNVLSVTILDIETQEHILEHHVPTAISRHNVGLLVIDSVTGNYRAEENQNSFAVLLERASKLRRLGKLLRDLAVNEKIAVVVANQVSDQFTDAEESHDLSYTEENAPGSLMKHDEVSAGPQIWSPQSHTTTRPVAESPKQTGIDDSPLISKSSEKRQTSVSALPNALHLQIPDLETVLTLDRQRPFQSGWGFSTDPSVVMKAPALGVVWTNQISCRIVLKMEVVPSAGLSQDQKVTTETKTGPLAKSHNTNVESPERGASTRKAVIPPSPSSILLGDDDDDEGDDEAVKALKPDNDKKQSTECGDTTSALHSPDKLVTTPMKTNTSLKRGAKDEKNPGDATRRNAFGSPPRKVAKQENPAYPHDGDHEEKEQQHDFESRLSSPDPFAAELLYGLYRRRRTMQVVFCPWASGCPLGQAQGVSAGGGVPLEYDILASGIRGISRP